MPSVTKSKVTGIDSFHNNLKMVNNYILCSSNSVTYTQMSLKDLQTAESSDSNQTLKFCFVNWATIPTVKLGKSLHHTDEFNQSPKLLEDQPFLQLKLHPLKQSLRSLKFIFEDTEIQLWLQKTKIRNSPLQTSCFPIDFNRKQLCLFCSPH